MKILAQKGIVGITSMIKAIIFLGNPGISYLKTRHSIGFQLAYALWDNAGWKEKFKALWQQTNFCGINLHLLMPQTYMNKSGESVLAFLNFFKLDIQELLVVHDDLETPFGSILFKKGGGTAGHNGLRSIQRHLSSPNFYRLALGISRPEKGDPASYVLNRFSPLEESRLPELFLYTERYLKEILPALPSDSSLPRRISVFNT